MGKQQYIEAGQIANTHGVAGELKIQVWLDSPEFMKRFRRLYIDGKAYSVHAARVHKAFLLVLLEGVEDVNAAMPFKGKTVFIDRDDANLPPGGYFLQDLLGARVEDEQGRAIGTLSQILERPASLIYVVQGEREHWIPAVPEFVLEKNVDEGRIVVRLIEGM